MTKRKPGRPSLSSKEKGEIREDIIRIARELFVNEGYENTSMRKIAALAGFAPTKIYYYFENKKEILKHFWNDIAVDMWVHCKPTMSSSSNEPVAHIRHIMKRSIDYWISNPKSYQLLIETQDYKADPQDNLDIYHTPGTKDYVETLMTLVQQCMKDGIFRQDDALFVCQLITVSAFGVYGSYYSLPSIAWVDRDKFIASSIDNTLKGLQN